VQPVRRQVERLAWRELDHERGLAARRGPERALRALLGREAEVCVQRAREDARERQRLKLGGRVAAVGAARARGGEPLAVLGIVGGSVVVAAVGFVRFAEVVLFFIVLFIALIFLRVATGPNRQPAFGRSLRSRDERVGHLQGLRVRLAVLLTRGVRSTRDGRKEVIPVD
jgi:hypothetical protein